MSRKFNRQSRRGFTLIELLVVIAIIAILISVLLPALSSARKHGQATKCGANLHHVGQAMQTYQVDSNGVYPPGYVYPDENGDWDLDQNPSNPYGYLHWSWFLYQSGQAPETAFQCPSFPNGGAPRTNPGTGPWEPGQVDDNGQSGSNPGRQDRQAERMAYTGNAAIFPRNKFTNALSGGPRINRLVNDTEIHDLGKTILTTEFKNDWKAVAIQQGGWLSKSHRPVNPFMHLSSGSDEYSASPTTPGFTYGNAPYYTLQPRSAIENQTNLLDNPGISELNAVGRHHPGGDDYTGGTANFLYGDGHVEKKSLLQTVKNWEWGLKYYAISGENKVGPPF